MTSRRGWDTRSAGLDWAGGYVVDTPYIDTLVVDICPAWLSMISVLRGQPPLDMDRPLTWVDLGCGSGLSAIMVAAAHPNVTVWGCDYNPAHIERARDVAARVGLRNCTFAEATFEELNRNFELGPAEADVIVVNGVYSWVSAANQREIVEFIRRRLRPGGVAHLMYGVAPGWASMVPIAEVMRLVSEVDGRRGDLVIPDAVASAQRLVAGSPHPPVLGLHEQRQFAELPTADPRYAAHEYLGGHFAPLMFEDVAFTMADARCAYLGSLDVTDHLAAFWAPAELNGVLNAASDLVLRETLRDLITQRALRRDVYRRGFASVAPFTQQTWLEDLTVVGLGKPWSSDVVADVPVGQVGLDEAFYLPLVDALEHESLGPRRIRDLHPEIEFAEAVTAMCLLVASGFAAPERAGWRDDTEAQAQVRRLNQFIVAENRAGANHERLVAPATGGALVMGWIEGQALGGLWEGTAPDARALALRALDDLARQGRSIRERGVVIDDRHEAEAVAIRRATLALERAAGVWGRLGIA